MEIMLDHDHLLLECDPQFGVHKAVKAIKARSFRLLRSEFPRLKQRLPTLWTNAYFVATTGGVSIDKIKKYVENQKYV